MQTTTNYGLKKPEVTEFYDVQVNNDNMDAIDAKMKEIENAAGGSQALTEHIEDKSNPHGVTKAQVGLSNVPNVSTNNQTPTYAVPDTATALESGEKLSVAMGKIAKAVSEHISRNVYDTMEEVEANTQENQLAGALAVKELKTDIASVEADLMDTVPYNLIPFPYYDSAFEENGISWSVDDDGVIVANGKATVDENFICRHRISQDSNPLILPAGTYTLSGCPIGGGSRTYYVNVGETNPTNNSFLVVCTDFGNGATFTIEKETQVYVGCCVTNGYTVNNVTFKPMLAKGDTAKEFRKNFKSVYEMQQYLTGTLTAGETTLTISDSSITEDSMIDIYTNVFGVNPTEVTVASGSITLVFDAQETDLGVKVRVM